MLNFLTTVLAAICVAPLLFGYRRARPENFVLWVLGLFSLGYFVFPLVFRDRSPLRFVDDDIVVNVVFMALLFLAAVMVGATASRFVIAKKALVIGSRSILDRVLFDNARRTFLASLVGYYVYILNATLTVYQAGGVSAYSTSYGALDAIIAFVGNMSLAVMAIIFARTMDKRSPIGNLIVLLFYLSPIVILVGTAQRNAVLLPFVYLASAVALYGRARLAFKTAIGGVVLVGLLSPILVFFRESSSLNLGMSFSDAVSVFSFGGDALEIVLMSLVDRADVLYNSVLILQNFDQVGFATSEYFYSVLWKFVPGVFFESKPMALSTTGGLDGHLSVIAWSLVKGDFLGSVTIFGAISAYREGGWSWMFVNGLLTGLLYTLLYRKLAGQEEWKRVFYVVIFPGLCVKSVPPSLFEMMTAFSGLLYAYVLILGVDKIILRKR